MQHQSAKNYNSIQNQQVDSLKQNMKENYIHVLKTENSAKGLFVEYDQKSRQFLHLYQGVNLQTTRFKQEIKLYLNRKDSFSGNVVTVHKIGDEHIAFNGGDPGMQINVVTQYIPWRLDGHNKLISYEEALFLLNGSFRGFRELLHRIRFPFLVQDYMIGIDINGDVRVWWNREYSCNKFPFTLTSQIKLKDMVMSLVRLVTSKMNQKDVEILQQNLFVRGDITFLALQQNIQYMAKGLNLKFIGKNIINSMPQVVKITKFLKQITNSLENSRISNYSRMVSPQYIKSQQRIILTPEKVQPQAERLRDKFINKRIYKQGYSPDAHRKLNIIKNDIESLRFTANYQKDMTLRASRSVSNLYSYNKGIHGNPEIPEVNTLIKQAQIVASNDVLTVSRFVTPSSVLNPQAKPEPCYVCNGISRIRKSETMFESRATLQLSRIRSLQNLTSEKQHFSTERSINESKLAASYVNYKLRESEKKLSSNRYFTRLFSP